MAPLPNNNTARLLIEYTAGGHEHVTQIRLAEGLSGADQVGLANSFSLVMAPLLPTSDSVHGARVGAAGSNLTFPITITNRPGTDTNPVDTDKVPGFVSATGRSLLGRRCRVTIFTTLIDPDTTGWRQVIPSPIVQDILDWLQENNTMVRAIDGQGVLWNTYINYGFNAYYQRKLRRTSS